MLVKFTESIYLGVYSKSRATALIILYEVKIASKDTLHCNKFCKGKNCAFRHGIEKHEYYKTN